MNEIAGEKYASDGAATPLSFVVGVTDIEILRNNFMASPCVTEAASPHEAILVRGGPNVTAKLSRGLEQAEHDWVVCIHQDVWLPPSWDLQLVQQIREAERLFGPIGVAGVYGVGEVAAADDFTQPMSADRIGWVIDRGRMLKDGPELPARIATLDELLFVVRCDTPLKLDPALGNHFYGLDLCLQAQEKGLATVALAALCKHNSRHIGLGEGFHESAAKFAQVETSPAGGHALRDHRPRRIGAPAGQCHAWTSIDGVYLAEPWLVGKSAGVSLPDHDNQGRLCELSSPDGQNTTSNDSNRLGNAEGPGRRSASPIQENALTTKGTKTHEKGKTDKRKQISIDRVAVDEVSQPVLIPCIAFFRGFSCLSWLRVLDSPEPDRAIS